MKISSLNNLQFQKRLIANCAVKGAQKAIPCHIYQLEYGDEDYFENLSALPGWKNQDYIYSVDYDARNGYIDDIYVLEEENGTCLGYVEAGCTSNDKMIVEFIEVKPCNRNKLHQSKKQYIGETLLNFVAQLSKRMKKDKVHVIYPTKTAYGFYEKCGFVDDEDTGFKLSTDRISSLQEQNLSHTGHKIEFVV